MLDESIFFTPSVRIFLKVCQTQSFSIAAKQLSMTQPAVSMAITSLEKKLGVDLFRRSRPLELTPEGVTLEKTLMELADKSDAVVTDIKRRQRMLPEIRLGVINSLRDLLGLDLIAQFKGIASRISLISGTSDRLLSALDDGVLDIVVAGDRPDINSTALHKAFIVKEQTVVIFPKAIARTRDRWSWNNIRFSGLPLIRYSHSWSNEQILDEFRAVQKCDFQTVIEVDSNRLMLKLVATGEGWAITHPACLGNQTDFGSAIELLSPQPELKGRNLYVFYRRTALEQYANIIVQLVRRTFPCTHATVSDQGNQFSTLD